jgi:hypothetical protein
MNVPPCMLKKRNCISRAFSDRSLGRAHGWPQRIHNYPIIQRIAQSVGTAPPNLVQAVRWLRYVALHTCALVHAAYAHGLARVTYMDAYLIRQGISSDWLPLSFWNKRKGLQCQISCISDYRRVTVTEEREPCDTDYHCSSSWSAQVQVVNRGRTVA